MQDLLFNPLSSPLLSSPLLSSSFLLLTSSSHKVDQESHSLEFDMNIIESLHRSLQDTENEQSPRKQDNAQADGYEPLVITTSTSTIVSWIILSHHHVHLQQHDFHSRSHHHNIEEAQGE